jgi:hypothetical protein
MQQVREELKEQDEARRALQREKFSKMMDDEIASCCTPFTPAHERVMRQAWYVKAWYSGFLYAMKTFVRD